MVGKHSRHVLLALALVALTPLFASGNPVIGMDLLPTLSYSAQEDSWTDQVVANLTLTLSSKNEGNVRGEVVLKGNNLSVPTSFDDVVHKAYFKARFPSFRLTAGKTRLSWGEGMLFNAGDVLYGDNSASVSLTQAELRSTTSWLASVNYPLGYFSFAEAVVMPSETQTPTDLFLAARYYTTVKGLKMEAGYATRKPLGEARVHKPYLSLQGNVGFDWYLSSSLAIPEEGAFLEESKESWLVSGGIFYLQRLPHERSLTLRLEALTRPFGDWKTHSVKDADAALLFYPELSLAYSPALSFSLRSIISPLDLSARATFSTIWNVFEAFNLVGSISCDAGNAGDLFPWNSTGSSLSVTVGSSWVF
ncbi:hypothetical protein [Sphaerochaeta sp. PS]|uniref:hypothetical protein n=1 Tax=Sphaerochaeta sp. PS TaxID=3076336 RepID=UPI0028A5763F|nr:hypothetical protein [Sphaerochaeta sp. PS]MDT4760992.1 hypothetical protein [Sphaerochaeta sp. PS]